ncbi:hypothetical protein AJ78_01572 [Emergomyces pasteurianus Ep9510]|uniref:BZIP domain-containing protein n=1 Tax=Emergomyces pasteurianus Ep9510 TaxID=1447872 RepID=A0A1J9PPI4_9EURO|nr:hypothetical protein AJ78_01572 [Emergomyces pasteurianus Ep9510]
MSGYNGRRAPNFSQYLNELNTIPSPYDQAQQAQDLFDVDAELALFTNAEFLDFDPIGNLPVDIPVKFESGEGTDISNKNTPTAPLSEGDNIKYIDMLNDFNLPNYTSTFPSPILPMQAPVYPLPQQQAPNRNGSPLAPSGLERLVSPQPTSALSPTHPSPSPSTPSVNQATTRRKQDAMTPGSQSMDEAARLAQEEDKRRRNTAASARFRIKKKEREKNMERTVKDVTAKNAALEARINQLEMENRWLKNLITEKNGGAIADGDIAGMFDKYRATTEASQHLKLSSVKPRVA